MAPDGSPEADGRSPAAPTTLDAAIARAVTDDSIVLRGGVYRTGNLEVNQGITLQPYGDEAPILKGTQVATQWEAVGEGVWRTRWTTLFPSQPMFWWQRAREEARTPLHRFNNDMVFVDGRFLQSAGSIEELEESTHFIDYEAQQVYIGTNPEGHTVEITAHDIGILRVTTDLHGKASDRRGFVLRGITLTQYAWPAIAIDGERHFTHLDEPVDEPIGPADPATYGKQVVGTRLENVTISWCSRVGGYFRGDGLGSWVLNSADAHLYNNTYVDSPVRFSRDQRSAQGDHFNWHPATGPGVTEREGHIFLNNLMVTSRPGFTLLSMGQPQPLCSTLTKPALTAMDGNVYVRPAAPYPAAEGPLVNWVDTDAADCSARFASLEAFQARVPGFEAHGRQLEGDARGVFAAPDLGRYNLLRPLSAGRGIAMPRPVREWLGWSEQEAAATVGAYRPR